MLLDIGTWNIVAMILMATLWRLLGTGLPRTANLHRRRSDHLADALG